jgi:hypothetical protein
MWIAIASFFDNAKIKKNLEKALLFLQVNIGPIRSSPRFVPRSGVRCYRWCGLLGWLFL